MDPEQMDSEETLTSVANNITFFIGVAAVGLAMMLVFDSWERSFQFGSVMVAVALVAILLDVRVAIAPIGIPLKVLRNLEPAPEPEQNLPAPQKKERHLKLVVNNKRRSSA